MHGLELMYNDAPVCPYCRAAQGDSWELGLPDGETDVIECYKCGQQFEVECHVDYTYSSSIIPRPSMLKTMLKEVKGCIQK